MPVAIRFTSAHLRCQNSSEVEIRSAGLAEHLHVFSRLWDAVCGIVGWKQRTSADEGRMLGQDAGHVGRKFSKHVRDVIPAAGLSFEGSFAPQAVLPHLVILGQLLVTTYGCRYLSASLFLHRLCMCPTPGSADPEYAGLFLISSSLKSDIVSCLFLQSRSQHGGKRDRKQRSRKTGAQEIFSGLQGFIASYSLRAMPRDMK